MDHCDATGILPTQTSSSILPPYSTQTRGHSNVDFETTAQQHPTVKEVKNHIANDINNPITTTPALDTPRRSVSIRIPEEADYDAQENEMGIGICGWLLTAFSWAIVIVTLPFSLCVCFKVVQEYERAVIFRLGRLLEGGSKGPGLHFSLPCVESHEVVDMRTITLSVPPQEVLTKDSVTVSVDAVVYYRVSNATVSVANVENAHHSTRLLAQTTLRNILGTKSLHEILSDRESISNSMQNALDEATEPWGIKVERVEIKDVRLPVQLQRAMAAEAEAAREARAKVIAAEGEQKASRALREAAEIVSESPAAIQLRYLQMSSLSSKDARLPEQLQRAMAAEAEASREARAKVIAADGEKRASKALREASNVIDESPSALQLRYLQTLSSIAAEKNSTIIFPVPIDFVSQFIRTPPSTTTVSPRKAK